MNGLLPLFQYILWGEFGLLTMMPRYLFCVLLPVMIFLGFLSAILERISFLQNSRRGFFYAMAGLGCTTAALAASSAIHEKTYRRKMVWILILLIPCSSQITMMAAFASMVTLRVFLAYLLFTSVFTVLIYMVLNKCYPIVPLPDHRGVSFITPLRPLLIFREGFLSVTGTIPSFAVGSIIISGLTYFGCLDAVSSCLAPWLQALLHLPKEAVNLFIVNLFKRDLGSASLLSFAEAGAFDGIQIVVVMIMLTYSVPCFNSTVLLFKQEKLPMAIFLWMGSFCVSFLLGVLVCHILLQCTF